MFDHENHARGDVTEIELELKEAPEDMILVGSIPSKLDVIAEINSTYPDGIPKPNAVIVRAEEALIVILVLLLWAAAIALFFNRWRKIRMLEPYQPKFQQEHRQSCTTTEQNKLQMKYLGLVIDSQWTFEPHFDCLIPKVPVAANALCGLLPNIGGAGDAVSRLYEDVVRSRVMYAALV
ncbi:uncharacterized protein LOC117238904 [Bombus vosnesenskii]|uniref:Uncharacterized protein LOC117238904 n=1 Tax=Bombus vosnesenskii TaxID=207650 RepID=A0A6J3L3Y6_9HYME|nr:uncharacterized protein LOC117238904 [Bombus vosnesenskii]